jgi:hypothetical protein
MVLYPEVMRKAQEELDRVVGQDRLPSFSDKPALPYICAVIQEVLRWAPVTPLAVAHSLTADDIYEGKFLPSGSLVLGNAWYATLHGSAHFADRHPHRAMLNDEKMYPRPEIFNPDRFLKDGKLDPNIRSPETVAFGFGRRYAQLDYLCDIALTTAPTESVQERTSRSNLCSSTSPVYYQPSTLEWPRMPKDSQSHLVANIKLVCCGKCIVCSW